MVSPHDFDLLAILHAPVSTELERGLSYNVNNL